MPLYGIYCISFLRQHSCFARFNNGIYLRFVFFKKRLFPFIFSKIQKSPVKVHLNDSAVLCDSSNFVVFEIPMVRTKCVTELWEAIIGSVVVAITSQKVCPPTWEILTIIPSSFLCCKSFYPKPVKPLFFKSLVNVSSAVIVAHEVE